MGHWCLSKAKGKLIIMKATKKNLSKTLMLILVIVVLLALTACSEKAPGGNADDLLTNSPESQPEEGIDIHSTMTGDEISGENSTPPSATSPPLLPSPDPVDPNVILTIPSPLAEGSLTFYEAMAICSDWLKKHADLPSYTIHDWGYTSGETPPPTYLLYGKHYYEFLVSSHWDRAPRYLHSILVDAETGELLSLYMMKTDGERQTTTVEPLDTWSSNEHAAYGEALITADEAIEIYNKWKNDHFNASADSSHYRLNVESYDNYEIFGEQYYYFHTEEANMYWYNILINIKTGELLFMMISDGMYPIISIEPLDDWYDRSFAP
jgi:hypothetical protein